MATGGTEAAGFPLMASSKTATSKARTRTLRMRLRMSALAPELSSARWMTTGLMCWISWAPIGNSFLSFSSTQRR